MMTEARKKQVHQDVEQLSEALLARLKGYRLEMIEADTSVNYDQSQNILIKDVDNNKYSIIIF